MFASKMSTIFMESSALFLLLFWTSCQAQMHVEEAEHTSGAHGEGGGAFFALRSCHQLLQGDSGEFFSPDYVCANPPLWCNWTIQVGPGKRVQLHLEDLTPDDACNLKQDQIHVDEPAGPSGAHKVLQRCWREAKYTSSSRTVHVVLLIGGWPAQSYRGFYGRYRAFGPPMAYHPQDGVPETDLRSKLSHGLEFGETTAGGQHPTSSFVEWTIRAESPSSEKNFLAEPTSPTSGHGISRSQRGVARMLSDLPAAERPHGSPATKRRDVDEGPVLPGDHAKNQAAVRGLLGDHEDVASKRREGAENKVAELDRPVSPSEEAGEQSPPHPNMVEPLSDLQGNRNVHNGSGVHGPSDHLFEVTVEVHFSQNQVQTGGSLMKSVKALVLQHLNGLDVPLTLTFKRIKRLRAGELHIIWVNTGSDSENHHVYASVHSDLQGLVGVSLKGNQNKAVIASVSIADVNECGTQLARCDVNAECSDQFGSYSCRCKAGFRDESHPGPGGTVCVEEKAEGTSSGCTGGLSAETKGVYVVFFLLSALIVLLLVTACTLYRRHHRGGFSLRCGSKGHASQHCRDDGYSSPANSDLPPPPPPSRGPRDGWAPQRERRAAVDVPLLRFGALRPSDSYTQAAGRS
ncbi:uncharacterized protein [Nerophis lumbriciformis]|uniref:uncharacterized protein n=1 Tax=Nerophis lumbriciformis TaxID=546530 RepID=UPI002AE04A8B|nr:uncharacterized protein zgc:66455 [Nerophis lumbriciformis]